jgi:hypothetical protein
MLIVSHCAQAGRQHLGMVEINRCEGGEMDLPTQVSFRKGWQTGSQGERGRGR